MKRFLVVILAITLCLSLVGCGFWMEGEYLSVTPHVEQDAFDEDRVIQISNYSDAQEAMDTLVESGSGKGVLSLPVQDATIADMYIRNAITYVMNENPIGAYAVNEIKYEIGTSRGVSVIACNISYLYERGQILRIQKVSTMQELSERIYQALNTCEPSATIMVEEFKTTDFQQLVQNYADENPNVVMEVPTVSMSSYPEKGNRRIVDVYFTYRTNRESLRDMQEKVGAIFTSAELYVRESAQVLDIYTRLYSFMMERNTYTLETSITPAYSLLLHGVGDSRAFATVYAAMCRQSGLDCRVVSGTKDGKPRFWNIIQYRDQYHHVDLLESKRTESFQMLPDYMMYGYVWDYSAYPRTE